MRLLEEVRHHELSILGGRKSGHPRVFLRREDIPGLRERALGPLRDDWNAAQRELLSRRPCLEASALCFLVSQEEFYLELAKEHIRGLLATPAWGGAPYDPDEDRDLSMGFSLCSLAIGYDLLFHALDGGERDRIRDQVARNGRLLHAHFQNPGKTWRYPHNHAYVSVVGLAIAGYALYGEIDEAADWLRLAEVFLDRTLQCTGADGWYYEGWWVGKFWVPYLFLYAEAHYQMTGSMKVFQAPLLRLLPVFARYALLPGGGDHFDFGDSLGMFVPEFERLGRIPYEPGWVGIPWREALPQLGGREGLVKDSLFTRIRIGEESAYPIAVMDLAAARLRDGHAQRSADDIRLQGRGTSVSRFPGPRSACWSLLWKDPGLEPLSPECLPPHHYFPDHEVAVWRSGWAESAAAVAIKCGPPFGHLGIQRRRELPDFHCACGHPHPDAGSFILWSHGQYLCTDTGYTMPHRTAEHNCLLIDGRGQEIDDNGTWFRDVPFDRLDRIRMLRVDMREECMYAEADMTHAYPPELEMGRIVRRFLVSADCLIVWDILDSDRSHEYVWLLHTDTDYGKDASGYRTTNGDAALSVRFLQEGGLRIAVEKTVVTAHQHSSRSQGPAQERGHHLAVRQRGGHCRFAACLTWGWKHERIPDIEWSCKEGELDVAVGKRGSRRVFSITSEGGSIRKGWDSGTAGDG